MINKTCGKGPNHINNVWSGHLCGVWSGACNCEWSFPKKLVKSWVKSWVQIGSGPYVYVWVNTHFLNIVRVNQVSCVDIDHSKHIYTSRRVQCINRNWNLKSPSKVVLVQKYPQNGYVMVQWESDPKFEIIYLYDQDELEEVQWLVGKAYSSRIHRTINLLGPMITHDFTLVQIWGQVPHMTKCPRVWGHITQHPEGVGRCPIPRWDVPS